MVISPAAAERFRGADDDTRGRAVDALEPRGGPGLDVAAFERALGGGR